ncbi:MAG: NAD(P)H-dependent oxidoreductase subunit E, partial [Thermoplasmatota archaeon]
MSSSEEVNPQVPDEEIEEITQDYPHEPSSLIPMLQASQEKFGYLPRNVMSKIADSLGLSESKVYGVATFYAQFRFEPLGD